MKESNAEKREFDQMMREEIESGNPFAKGSYKARTRNKQQKVKKNN
jgi:hypothetical protein